MRPLGVPFVSFWLQFRDDLDARTHISSNPLWVSPRFGGVPRCPAIYFEKPSSEKRGVLKNMDAWGWIRNRSNPGDEGVR